MEEKTTTNQEAMQQILTNQKKLNARESKEMSNQINISALKIGMNSEDGPHNKYQKHSNKNAVLAEVMDNVDALHGNRHAQAPDPGGLGNF
eukprot:15362419-Ditylum_brightwellii.AAC.1